jgi:hypothetical protein
MRTPEEVQVLLDQIRGIVNVRVKRRLDRGRLIGTISMAAVLDWVLGQRDDSSTLIELAATELANAVRHANRPRANYEIVSNTPDRLTIRDLGPWDQFWTVSNDVEQVVAELYLFGHLRRGQRLFYYDSAGALDEILHKDGRFRDFQAGNPCRPEEQP